MINTIPYADSLGSPKADLNALSWIQGHWKGKAFGGVTEEVCTPVLGDSMMCTFKLVVNGEGKFCDLATIIEENKVLIPG